MNLPQFTHLDTPPKHVSQWFQTPSDLSLSIQKPAEELVGALGISRVYII